MNIRRGILALSAILIIASAQMYSASQNAPSASAQSFLGRWDLTLKTTTGEAPSWLKVTQENGQFKAQYVGRSGNARPLPKVEISNDQITFVSPKEEEDRKDDMIFQGKLVGDKLVGTTTGPDGSPWQCTGVRAPSLKRTGEPKWGEPIKLFNGKDLSGWTPSDP